MNFYFTFVIKIHLLALKTTMSMTYKPKPTGFPVIDGHFWVERDGEIIDPYFIEYDFIKVVNRLEGMPVHMKADDIVSKVIIRRFENVISYDLLFKMMKDNYYQVSFGKCYLNAVLEVRKNGGELCFGSMGWKRKRSDDIHWEYGGSGWTVKQFLKQ